jgi:hypothetical protein
MLIFLNLEYIQLKNIKLKQDNRGKTVNIKQVNIPSASKWWHQHWHIRNHHVPSLFGETTFLRLLVQEKRMKDKHLQLKRHHGNCLQILSVSALKSRN